MSVFDGNTNTPLTEDEIESLRKRIEGKRVVSVSDDSSRLALDDGTILHLYMSASDCCANAYGDWVIRPDSLDAIITDVKIDILADREDDGDGATSHATVTILHNQNPVALADCYANDGNGGYYFSVLSLKVLVPDAEAIDVTVVEA